MTTKEADKIIKSGAPVRVKSKYEAEFTKVFVRRDRYNIYSADGGVYDRGDLMLLK